MSSRANMGDSIIIARGLDSARRLASLTADGRCTPDALVALLTSPEGSEARREQSPPNHEDGAGLDPAQKAVFDALRSAFLEPEATLLGVRLRLLLLCAGLGNDAAAFLDSSLRLPKGMTEKLSRGMIKTLTGREAEKVLAIYAFTSSPEQQAAARTSLLDSLMNPDADLKAAALSNGFCADVSVEDVQKCSHCALSASASVSDASLKVQAA